MKFITTLFIGAVLTLSGSAAWAAGKAGYSIEGNWTMNAQKSKFIGPAFKSQTREYTVAADGTTTMSFKGETTDGSAVSGGSTFKYDGKDYPITGSSDFDTLTGKKVNATTVKITLKKGEKVVGSGTRMFSAHGKVFTLSTKVKGADGKTYTSSMVFEKQ